jgi:predicted MFS family arabinose efflux permease
MTSLALPWFVLTTTGSAKQMSYVVAAEIAAFVICAIPAASLITRLGSRQTMLACDGLRAPLMLVIPILHWSGVLVFGELVAVAFVLGALTAPYMTSQRIITAELLDEDPGLVGRANALFQGATRVTLVAGPPLGGVLIGVIGAANVLVIDASTFAVAFVLVLLFVPRRSTGPRDSEDRPRLLDGLRYLRRDRLLAAFSGAISIGDAAFSVIFLSLQVLVVDHYGGNARLVGLFLGAWGGGCVVGNLVAYRRIREGLSGAAIAGLAMVQALPLLALALPIPAWTLVVALGASGIGNGLVNPTLHSLLTLRPPANVRPNVLTAVNTASTIGAPAALVIAGPAYGAFGSRPVVGVAAALQVVAMVWLGAAAFRLAGTPAPDGTQLHES